MTETTIFDRAAATSVLRKIADAAPREGTYWHGAWLRDLLLMSWVLYHPQRIAQLFRMTYQADNSGHLFKNDLQGWSYRTPTSGHVTRVDEYALAEPVACLIEPYLELARPRLLRKANDSLFNMPSNHMHRRIGTLLKDHSGRAVSFGELRELKLGT